MHARAANRRGRCDRRVVDGRLRTAAAILILDADVIAFLFVIFRIVRLRWKFFFEQRFFLFQLQQRRRHSEQPFGRQFRVGFIGAIAAHSWFLFF